MVRYLCGTVSLIAATAFFLNALVVSIVAPAARPQLPRYFSLLFVVFGVFFTLAAAYFWIRSVKVTPGDDIFSDQRGLLVALMVVTTLVIAGGTMWLVLHLEFWQGALQGVLEALRD